MILGVLGVALDKISIPGQTVHFAIAYVIHILKAIVPADNLSYQKRIFEYPTRRQIFANTVGRICKRNLTLRRRNILLSVLLCELK